MRVCMKIGGFPSGKRKKSMVKILYRKNKNYARRKTYVWHNLYNKT